MVAVKPVVPDAVGSASASATVSAIVSASVNEGVSVNLIPIPAAFASVPKPVVLVVPVLLHWWRIAAFLAAGSVLAIVFVGVSVSQSQGQIQMGNMPASDLLQDLQRSVVFVVTESVSALASVFVGRTLTLTLIHGVNASVSLFACGSAFDLYCDIKRG